VELICAALPGSREVGQGFRLHRSGHVIYLIVLAVWRSWAWLRLRAATFAPALLGAVSTLRTAASGRPKCFATCPGCHACLKSRPDRLALRAPGATGQHLPPLSVVCVLPAVGQGSPAHRLSLEGLG
jgi:hypothetical protein